VDKFKEFGNTGYVNNFYKSLIAGQRQRDDRQGAANQMRL